MFENVRKALNIVIKLYNVLHDFEEFYDDNHNVQ